MDFTHACLEIDAVVLHRRDADIGARRQRPAFRFNLLQFRDFAQPRHIGILAVAEFRCQPIRFLRDGQQFLRLRDLFIVFRLDFLRLAACVFLLVLFRFGLRRFGGFDGLTGFFIQRLQTSIPLRNLFSERRFATKRCAIFLYQTGIFVRLATMTPYDGVEIRQLPFPNP